MELFYFGLNLILVLAVWHFMIRPSLLDHARDRLFDLRDELRSEFLKNRWDIGSPDYKRLRDLVNGHLRFTEEMSVMRVAVATVELKANSELQEYMKEKMTRVFISADPKQRQFIAQFRARAVDATMEYATLSSGVLMLAVFAIAPFIAAHQLFRMLNKQVDFTLAFCIKKCMNFGRDMSSSFESSVAMVGKMFVLPDYLESASFKRGLVV